MKELPPLSRRCHADQGRASGLAAADGQPQARGVHRRNGCTENLHPAKTRHACGHWANPRPRRDMCSTNCAEVYTVRRRRDLRSLSGFKTCTTCNMQKNLQHAKNSQLKNHMSTCKKTHVNMQHLFLMTVRTCHSQSHQLRAPFPTPNHFEKTREATV